MKKSDLHKIIREEIQNHMIEEGIVNWLVDKAERFVVNALNHKADYQYARILSNPDFKALHKKYGMSQKDFLAKAKSLMAKNPKKFADLLMYDVKKSRYSKFF